MIGIDICDVTRFERLAKDDAFLNKVFTQEEIDYCSKDAHKNEHFAGKFAAKEAFAKAVGTGFGESVRFKEVQIINNQNGQPEIKLFGETANKFKINYPNKKNLYLVLLYLLVQMAHLYHLYLLALLYHKLYQ